MKCMITGNNPHLSFKLGEKVECKTEKGWQKGRVIGLWDGDMPYRVELTDDFLTNALNANHSFVSEEILVISHHVLLYKVIEQQVVEIPLEFKTH